VSSLLWGAIQMSVFTFFVAANAALTLADILSGSKMDDEGPCDGQRVQHCSSAVNDYGTRIPMEACGRLTLEDIYKEKFLLCHAFVGGINTTRCQKAFKHSSM